MSWIGETGAGVKQFASSCRLYQIPVCALVGLLGVVIDTPAICLVALWKSPFMLYKGWSRLIHDLVTRNGPCLEAACVPFAGLALLLWPLIVAFSALAAFLCSPLLGLFSAVVAYQVCGFASSTLFVLFWSVTLWTKFYLNLPNSTIYLEPCLFPSLETHISGTTLKYCLGRRYILRLFILFAGDVLSMRAKIHRRYSSRIR